MIKTQDYQTQAFLLRQNNHKRNEPLLVKQRWILAQYKIYFKFWINDIVTARVYDENLIKFLEKYGQLYGP